MGGIFTNRNRMQIDSQFSLTGVEESHGFNNTKIVLLRIRVNDDPSLLKSQNLLQDDRPPTVLLHLAGHAEILLLPFPGVEEVGVAVITDDVTLDYKQDIRIEIISQEGKVSL